MNNNMLKVEFGFGLDLDLDGNPLSLDRVTGGLMAIRQTALGLFGGATLTRTEGDWQDPETGVQYSEHGATLAVLVEWSPLVEGKVKQLAEDIKKSLAQKCVYVTQFQVHSQLY